MESVFYFFGRISQCKSPFKFLHIHGIRFFACRLNLIPFWCFISIKIWLYGDLHCCKQSTFHYLLYLYQKPKKFVVFKPEFFEEFRHFVRITNVTKLMWWICTFFWKWIETKRIIPLLFPFFRIFTNIAQCTSYDHSTKWRLADWPKIPVWI